MQDYQLLIDDDRYIVLSLRFLTACDVDRALELAEKALSESPHHRGAELHAGDECLWSRGSLLRSGRAPRQRQLASF